MDIKFDNIQGKLIRLFKLHQRPNPIINIEEIMEAVQDGNKNFNWFKGNLDNLAKSEMMLSKDE